MSKVYAQDYVDTITLKTCLCIDTLKFINQKEDELKLGICMIEQGLPYKKNLKKNHDIDLDHLDQVQGRKLGQLLGLRLAATCPNFTKVIEQNTLSTEAEELQWKGSLVEIEQSQFVSFVGEDSEGKLMKFLVFEHFKNSSSWLDMGNEIKGKKVIISFERRELYDPKLNEFRNYNIIRSIE